jgi:hypothetical protein
VRGTALSTAPIAVATYPSLGSEGPEAKVNSWNGFAIDTRDSSVYSVANGGHWAYAGNEVNRIKLSDNVPVWTESRAATPPSQVIASVSHYADGRPTSRHTYYGTMIDEARDRAFLLAGSYYGNGWALVTMDGFNLTTKDWDAARTYPNIPTDLGMVFGSAMVQHKISGDIYAFPYWSVYRWNAATNTWSKPLSNTPFDGQYAASALDTKRNRILLLGGNSESKAVYDINANTIQAVALSGPDAGLVGGSENGMVYDPLLDAFLLRKGGAGGTIYRINAQTFNVDTLPAIAGAAIPAAINGVWRRFLYVPALKGIVYFPTYSGNLWFLRTAP